MELQGGGGTDHVSVFNRIEERMDESDIIICLTDGHTRVPETPPRIDVLWVVDNHNVDKDTLNFGRIIRADYHGEEV